jgi:uncharacterized protein (DUF849 family)
MAIAIREAGVLPELEVFETGHLLLAKKFLELGHVKPPGMFQICLGISWGQPATPEAMMYMRNLLPAGSPWFAFGISLHQFPMVAQTVLLGGHVRVGLEDNLYLARGKLAPSKCGVGGEGCAHHRGAWRHRCNTRRCAGDFGATVHGTELVATFSGLSPSP